MIKRFKQARKILGIGLLTSTAFAFFYSAQYEVLKLAINYWNPISITEYRLKNLSTEEFIAEIQDSIAENKLSEAAEIVEIAQEYGHQTPQELVDETKEGYFDTTVRWGKDFTNGFIYGNMNSGQGIAGTIISDFVLIGDLRDLGNEGTKLYNGDDYDSITLGMSAAGATTSILALSSAAGAITASTLDNSISIMKTAHKFGKLSKNMTANISRITADAVDFKKLKQSIGSVSSVAKMPSPTSIMAAVRQVDLKDVANGKTDDITNAFVEVIPIDLKAASNLTDGLVSPKALKEITDLAGSNAAVIKTGGFRTSFKALEIADDAKDMSKISTIAGKYGNKSASIFKVLGKKAYKLGKLIYLIGAIVIGIIGWLLYAAWLALSTARGTIRLINRAGKRA
ncbi:hypothetical protein [Brucella anthropi]